MGPMCRELGEPRSHSSHLQAAAPAVSATLDVPYSSQVSSHCGARRHVKRVVYMYWGVHKYANLHTAVPTAQTTPELKD